MEHLLAQVPAGVRYLMFHVFRCLPGSSYHVFEYIWGYPLNETCQNKSVCCGCSMRSCCAFRIRTTRPSTSVRSCWGNTPMWTPGSSPVRPAALTRELLLDILCWFLCEFEHLIFICLLLLCVSLLFFTSCELGQGGRRWASIPRSTTWCRVTREPNTSSSGSATAASEVSLDRLY